MGKKARADFLGTVVALLRRRPLHHFSAPEIARTTGRKIANVELTFDRLASRGMLIEVWHDGERRVRYKARGGWKYRLLQKYLTWGGANVERPAVDARAARRIQSSQSRRTHRC